MEIVGLYAVCVGVGGRETWKAARNITTYAFHSHHQLEIKHQTSIVKFS